jgi:hypothetical protein
MSAGLVGDATLAVLVGIVVLVLPGFGLRAVPASARALLARLTKAGSTTDSGSSRQLAQATPFEAAQLVTAVALSLCYCVLVGSAMLAFGAFTPTRLGVLTLLAAVAGLLPFARWCRGHFLSLALHLLLIVGLAAPVSLSVFGGGYRAAQSYQWFYWGLGRQLSFAHGVPDHVLEWGSQVRWQPDYLNFNLLSQAYLGLMRGVTEPTAMAVWRLPMTLLLIGMTFLMLRLWFSFVPAAVSTAALSATSLYIDKIGNNTPEAVGLALGLVAVWLGVEGVRRTKSSWLLLAGVMGGLTISVHAVAATVCALLLLAALIVELVHKRPPVNWWLFAIGASATASIVVVSALGLSLQGRTSPLGDAKNPADVGNVDPTYRFLQYSNGHFTTPVNRNSLHGIVTAPWPDASLLSLRWSWLLALVVVGLVGAIALGRSRERRGITTAALFTLLVAAVVAWFELRYDTFVPQHTGNVRIAVYLPITYVILLAAGVELVSRLVSSWWKSPRPRAARLMVVATVPTLAIGYFAFTTVPIMATRPAISDTGAQALAELKQRAPTGSVVLSNVATRGTLEYFTGLEDPAEGRQPLIEDRNTLGSAVQYLIRLHAFVQDPRRGELTNRLGATWFVLSKQPRNLGTGINYGLPASSFARKAGLKVVWQHDGIMILKAQGPAHQVRSIGPAKSLWGGFLVALALIGVVLWVAAIGCARADARVGQPRHRT